MNEVLLPRKWRELLYYEQSHQQRMASSFSAAAYYRRAIHSGSGQKLFLLNGGYPCRTNERTEGRESYKLISLIYWFGYGWDYFAEWSNNTEMVFGLQGGGEEGDGIGQWIGFIKQGKERLFFWLFLSCYFHWYYVGPFFCSSRIRLLLIFTHRQQRLCHLIPNVCLKYYYAKLLFVLDEFPNIYSR